VKALIKDGIDAQARSLKGRLSDRTVANLFLIPTVILLLAINIFPLLWSLFLSFCEYVDTASIPPRWVGTANYHQILHSTDIWNTFQVTARFTLLAIGVELAVGFGMALLLHRTFRARGMITTLLLVPMMLSPVVVGLFWNYMFQSSNGLINWLLQQAHLQNPLAPADWLNNPQNALWSLVIVDAWMWSPFVMLIALAGLQSVPPHLYEAADVDRASPWFKFRYITLPMVGPLLLIALLFRTIDCFKLFDIVYVLTGGGPGTSTQTVSYRLFKLAFDSHRTGLACALAYVILLLIIGLTNLFIKYLGRLRGEGIADAESLWQLLQVKAAPIPGLRWLLETPGRSITIVVGMGVLWYGLMALRTHQWPTPLLVFIGLVALVGFVALGVSRLPQLLRNLLAYGAIGIVVVVYLLPIYWIVVTSITPPSLIAALTPRLIPTHLARPDEPLTKETVFFGATFQNYSMLIFQHEGNEPSGRILGLSDFPLQIGNSLFIGILSTLFSVGLGTMAAYAFARFRIKAGGDLLFFVLSTRMLPAIAVVIPIFLMYRALGLLGTRTGLVLLYTVFNLSFSTYLLKGFFDDIPHEYDDAGLLDGYTRLQVFRKISLPQAVTGIAATAVFCFITAWNEFAFAQILSTQSPLTAPPSIVSRTGAGGTDWGQIAAGTVIFLIPVTLFTFAMRKHLLRGVTFGAIKR
jgi:multiple sugar transport system permease protein